MDVLIVIGIMFAIILAIFLLYCFKEFLEHNEKAYDIWCYTIAVLMLIGFIIAALGVLFLFSYHIAKHFNLIEPFLS